MSSMSKASVKPVIVVALLLEELLNELFRCTSSDPEDFLLEVPNSVMASLLMVEVFLELIAPVNFLLIFENGVKMFFLISGSWIRMKNSSSGIRTFAVLPIRPMSKKEPLQFWNSSKYIDWFSPKTCAKWEPKITTQIKMQAWM